MQKDIPRWGAYIRDAIVEPALGRDLLQLHPVASPALLRQLFGAAVALPAQVVSLQKLHSGRSRITSTCSPLSGILQSLTVAVRAVQNVPNALVRAFERPIGAPLSPERLGRYFENAIGARFLEAGWDTYYWKHRQDEVDFVVVGPDNQRYAIEVKTGSTSREELQHNTSRLYALFGEQSLDGIRHLPVRAELDP